MLATYIFPVFMELYIFISLYLKFDYLKIIWNMGGQYMSHVYNKSNEDIKISVTIAIPKTPDSVSIILMKPGEKKRFECGDKK